MTEAFKQALNEAVSRLCGWKVHPDGKKGLPPDKSHYYTLPRYAEDRNALPEVWEVVEKCGDRFVFLGWLSDLCKNSKWEAVKSYPHLHCIAALKALNIWTPELEALWQQEEEANP